MATYRPHPNYMVDPRDPDYIPDMPSFEDWEDAYYDALDDERKEDMTDEYD